MEQLSEQQGKRAALRAGSAQNIEEQLIPILKELLVEIKKRACDEQKWASLDRSLNQDLDTFVKLTGHVRNSLMRQQWKGDNSDFPDVARDTPKDPWIANIGRLLLIISPSKAYSPLLCKPTRISTTDYSTGRRFCCL
jgi:hypothetical protein